MNLQALAETSALLFRTCETVSRSLPGLPDNPASHNSELDGWILRVEIDSLAHILSSLTVGFNSPALIACKANRQYVGEPRYWTHIHQLMADCSVVFQNMKQGFLAEKKGHFKGGFGRQAAVPTSPFLVRFRKAQIAAYCQTMELSLDLLEM